MRDRITATKMLGQTETAQFISVDLKGTEIPDKKEVFDYLYKLGWYGGVIDRVIERGNNISVVLKAYKE